MDSRTFRGQTPLRLFVGASDIILPFLSRLEMCEIARENHPVAGVKLSRIWQSWPNPNSESTFSESTGPIQPKSSPIQPACSESTGQIHWQNLPNPFWKHLLVFESTFFILKAPFFWKHLPDSEETYRIHVCKYFFGSESTFFLKAPTGFWRNLPDSRLEATSWGSESTFLVLKAPTGFLRNLPDSRLKVSF